MKYLVTGGSGFVGSNYLHYVVNKYPEDQFVCVDMLTYAGNFNNIVSLLDKPNFKFYKIDIRNAEAIDTLFAKERPDCVINFAAESHVDNSIKNPTYFIGYVFGSSPMVWKVVRDWNKLPYKTNTEKSKLDYYSTKNITPIASYENVVMKNKGTEPYEQLNSFVNKIGENKIKNTLFDSPALYMYLSFILIGGIYLLTKSKDIFIVYLPNMLNILIIFASTPIQDVRYLYPNLLLFYFLIIMLLGILQKRKEIRIS